MRKPLLALAIVLAAALPAMAQEQSPGTTAGGTAGQLTTTPNPYQDALPGGQNDPNKQTDESIRSVDESYGKTTKELEAEKRGQAFEAWLAANWMYVSAAAVIVVGGGWFISSRKTAAAEQSA